MNGRALKTLGLYVLLGAGAHPSGAEEPGIVRWTLSAVVAGADAGSLLVEAGVDCWTLTGEEGSTVRKLYPTWLSVQSVDGTVRHREARLDRGGWLSVTDTDDVIVRNTHLTRVDAGWMLETSHPDFSLSLDLHPHAPSLAVDMRTVHPAVTVTGHVEHETGTGSVSGEGRVEVSRESLADALPRAGADALTFRSEAGGTVVIVRERDRRFGHTSRVRGIYAGAKGVVIALDPLDMSFYPLGRSRWTSPATGTDFPLRWRLMIPALNLHCEVEPLRNDQEIDGTSAWGTSLWRGPVRVFGWRDDVPLDARGTLELMGYGDSYPPHALLVERDAP